MYEPALSRSEQTMARVGPIAGNRSRHSSLSFLTSSKREVFHSISCANPVMAIPPRRRAGNAVLSLSCHVTQRVNLLGRFEMCERWGCNPRSRGDAVRQIEPEVEHGGNTWP